MISLQALGSYRLVQTKKHHTKLLYLDNDAYAWMTYENTGEILVILTSEFAVECSLSVGEYRLFKVEGESSLTDTLHLELEVGNNKWQGYLLLTGLPGNVNKHTRIIPTNEIISNDHKAANGQKAAVN